MGSMVRMVFSASQAFSAAEAIIDDPGRCSARKEEIEVIDDETCYFGANREARTDLSGSKAVTVAVKCHQWSELLVWWNATSKEAQSLSFRLPNGGVVQA